MKNTVRVHQNRTTNRKSSQIEIPDDLKLAESGAHPSCIAIYDRATQVPVCKIPLTENEFFDLLSGKTQRTSPAYGMEIKDFIAKSIRKELAPKADAGLDELELATLQSNALLQLLADKFDHLANRAGCAFEGDYANSLVDGIAMLTHVTQDRLTNAFNKTWNARHPKPATA